MVGNQPRVEVDQEVGGTAVSCVFDMADILEPVVDSLDDRSFPQVDLLHERDKLIFHIGFHSSHQLDPLVV